MTIATLPRDRRADLQPDALPLDLIGELGGSPDGADTADADSLGASFDDVRAGIQDWLRHWEPARIPAFTAARHVAPDAREHSSALKSAPTRDDGAVRMTASLYDPPNRAGEPLFWSRNWASVAVLPAAPEAGRLYYRFRVSSRLVLDGAADLSLVSTSMHFGIVADAAKSSPFQTQGFATPLARPLVGVQCRSDAEAVASQVFEGSITVRQGERPAMAFVIGTDLLFNDGWVRVHEGSSTWIGPADGASGIIEYRYAPAALLRSVAGSTSR